MLFLSTEPPESAARRNRWNLVNWRAMEEHRATVSEFDADTAVSPVGEGGYTATITPRWNIGDKPNGGYLMAVVARALQVEAAHPDLLVASGYFLRSPVAGPVVVREEALRAGRSVSVLAGRLLQEGRECLHLVATFGDLAAATGPTRVTLAPPPLPPPEECLAGDPRVATREPMAFAERMDTRFGPDCAGLLTGSPTGTAELTAWTRLADGREPDALALLVVVDGLPPAVGNLGLSGWVPTLELTVHLRARPAPGWLRARTFTRALIDGYLEEDALVWDADGRLVAQSRQLARVLAPET